MEKNNGNDKTCMKTNKNNHKRNNKRRNKKGRSSAQIDLAGDGTLSGDQKNQNVGSNADITLKADAQISTKSSAKKKHPNVNALPDDSSPVIENSQPSTSATSCEHSNIKGPNKEDVSTNDKKNFPAVGQKPTLN